MAPSWRTQRVCFSPDHMDHACGVWFPGFAATEFTVTSVRYDMTLSLLLLREDEA